MKKKLVSVLLSAAMVATLAAGCGSSGSGETDSEKTGETEDTVVVYTAHSEEMLDVIIEGFTEETGIEVECLNLHSELADRVISEKENPQADVIYGGDTATYDKLKEEGCLTASNPEWADELDDYFKDEEGYWYATIKTPVMMFYNTDMMSEEEAPKDWIDLADPKYKDQIITRGPVSSSMCTTLACWIDYFTKTQSEEAAWQFVADFDSNVKSYDNVTSLIMQEIGKGDAPIGISTLNDIYDNVENNDMPFKEINATSGNVVLADCAAVTNNAPHPSAAEAFLEYVGSAEVQAQIANDFFRLPTLDSALDDSPEWMRTEITALDVDWENINENKTAWVDKWSNEYINADKVEEE